jgi:hypothetical protein
MIMEEKENHFDIVVIGGGPAGIMAAGRAAELGRRVVLIEKNKDLGRKILLTGKGRCNVTHAEFDLRKLVSEYGKNGSFLYHAFSVFGVKSLVDFFEKRGLKTKTERGKRVFPVTDRARNVLSVLTRNLKKNKVNVVCGVKAKGFEWSGRKIRRNFWRPIYIVYRRNGLSRDWINGRRL